MSYVAKAVASLLVGMPAPAGVTVEPVFKERYVVLSTRGAMVTIDAGARGFRSGGYITYGSFVGRHGTCGYNGRGWVSKLHADAVAWLAANSDPA